MRRELWIVALAIIGWCLAGGMYFGRAVTQGPVVPGEAAVTAGGVEASQPAPSAPDTGVALMEWTVARGAGEVLRDPGGEGFDACLRGTARLIPSWGGGRAVAFDGTGDNGFWRGEAQNCGLFIEKRLRRGFGEMSVEAWVRKSRGGWMPVISRDRWDDESGFGLHMEWSEGKAVFGHYGSSSLAQSAHEVQDGRWHHVVGTMGPNGNGAYRYRIYVDGELDGEQTGSWGVAEAPAEGGVLMIAYPNNTGNEQPYKGDLGHMALFAKELSAAQVKARFEAQRPGEGGN